MSAPSHSGLLTFAPESVTPRAPWGHQRVLVVDNYDSFVFNLVQYLGRLGVPTDVVRNDDPLLTGLIDSGQAGPYAGILLSPGPGTPGQAGQCPLLLQELAGEVPFFGVCLGLQVIAETFGATVDRAPAQRHGKTSAVRHDGAGVLIGLAQPFTATRYHSLAVVEASVPQQTLAVTARSDDGVIMGLRHRDLPVEGVQFHPESVLSESGYQILANWLATCGDTGAPQVARDMSPLITLS